MFHTQQIDCDLLSVIKFAMSAYTSSTRKRSSRALTGHTDGVLGQCCPGSAVGLLNAHTGQTTSVELGRGNRLIKYRRTAQH